MINFVLKIKTKNFATSPKEFKFLKTGIESLPQADPNSLSNFPTHPLGCNLLEAKFLFLTAASPMLQCCLATLGATFCCESIQTQHHPYT